MLLGVRNKLPGFAVDSRIQGTDAAQGAPLRGEYSRISVVCRARYLTRMSWDFRSKRGGIMGWMKKGVMVGVAATALLVGCNNGQQARNSAASGSLALSTDDSLLYAADSDNGVVSVIDTKTDTKLYDVKVGT